MGKMSREKGAAFERALAGYLRPSFPRIDRAVRTGYRTATRTAADPGDLHGTTGIVWSAKDVGDGEPAPGLLRGWLAEVEVMVEGSAVLPTPVGVLVHKRRGHSDIGMAWAWLTFQDLLRLTAHGLRVPLDVPDSSFPVRVRLDDVMPALVAWEARWTS